MSGTAAPGLAATGRAAGPPASRTRFGVALKLIALSGAVIAIVLLVNAAGSIWAGFGGARSRALALQVESARAVAGRVAAALGEIETAIGWTTSPEWRRQTPEQQRYDLSRLLRQLPAVTEVSYLDGGGREQIRLSRTEPEAIGPGRVLASDPRFMRAIAQKVWFGPASARPTGLTTVPLAVSHRGTNPGVTLVELDLKPFRDLLAAVGADGAGMAYLVDADGRLLVHPDAALASRAAEFAALPQVAEATKTRSGPTAASGSRDLAGDAVLAGFAPVDRSGWSVLVETRPDSPFGPLAVTLLRTLALLVLGLGLSILGGMYLARRLTQPIRRLQRAADRVGGGDLAHRVTIRTGDEFDGLGQRFNQMVARLQESRDLLQARVDDRTRELGLSLEQQTATADVLEIISRATLDLDNVLRTLADTAARLCRTGPAQIFRRDGDVYRLWVSQNINPAYREIEERSVISPGRGTLVGRVAQEKGAVHIVDCLADPDYAQKDTAKVGGLRTILGVPLLSRGELIGAFALARTEVEPFTPRQIKLLTTFADQAVIAIENARLFEEVQARTRELVKSLEDLHAAQDRLVQTEKLASLGQLTAGIAHEIKNPLNFVNNFSSLSVDLIEELREILAAAELTDDAKAEVEELTEMLKDNLGKVVQHGKRADSIVKNMLLHSREGSGDHRPVDVNALVEEGMNLAYHGARAENPGYNVTLETSLDPAVGEVDLYPQEITRVLLNLFTNGFYASAKRKAAEPGLDPVLAVATRDLGGSIEIRVRDNGTGIPDDVKAKIFNPFFTTKPAGEGTGLGLSLSHDIVVKQHGGSIRVESEPGSWTEFTITLPRDGTRLASGAAAA